MRKLILVLLLIMLMGLRSESPLLRDNPQRGHYLSKQEIEIPASRDFYQTDPPASARNIAEFEPMEGVLIRYPFGISYSLIASFSQEDKVVTIVSSTAAQNTVTASYNSNGVNLANCEFLIAPSDSYWCRDYGPWYIYDGSEIAIVNFIYNRPRPNDNDIPIEVADFLNIPLYGMPLEQTGGNYMTDGYGISAATDLVIYENPDLTTQEINTLMSDYLGINNYHILPDPNNTYIDHIDCWGKFLAVDKVLIREVPASHAQYDEIEETADYFASQNCSWGYPYEVYRVYTPSDQPYTNSLILNKRVFVPITGSNWDDEALEVYETALPGYEIAGFTGSWVSTDALHCRTKGIADRNMLHVEHLPYWQEQSGGIELDFSAQIKAYSQVALLADSIYIGWRIQGEAWNFEPMTNNGSGNWESSLVLPNTEGIFQYYLHAADVEGNQIDHPLAGEYDPHQFAILQAIAYGDLDENGSVESFDAALLLQYVVGLDPLPELDPLPWDAARIIAADVDGSQELDSYDVSLILQYFVGIIEQFPVER
ncbi:MAG: agmatine deiminase family protein [Candidatus Cloacimonetes bacterium]|nr:agmatine deiminase family protein [Candidatus Cloacimonadota bacterium]